MGKKNIIQLQQSPMKLPSIRSLLHDFPQEPTQSTSPIFDFRPPSAPSFPERTSKTESAEDSQWNARPRSHAGTALSDASSIRRHRNARACDECRRRKIRCSKAAAENEGDQDAPCENCSKAGISCTFAHAVEAQKPVKHDWQPPKTTSSIHRKQTRHHHPSRPATSCTMSRPATSSALYSSIPPHSAGSLGGYSLAFTPSSDSGSRLSGTAASSLSFLSSPSHHSSSSSLFAYAPPLEPAWRMANISNVLASTSLQKTFLTFSRESATSDAAPLHAGAASVQSPMGCALDVAAQAIGTAMIGSAQSIKADSDALLLFYYDHFRQGRVGTELLMATCLKVGRLPPSLERDRRALSLSLIAAWHSMGYASQRPLLPCPSLDSDDSVALLQASALSPPSLQTLDVVKACLVVFGATKRESCKADSPAPSSDTVRCLLRFRSLYYRMCFAGREQRIAQEEEDILIAEAQELLDMIPLLNQTVLLVHGLALVATTLGALHIHFTANSNQNGSAAVQRIAQLLLSTPYVAGGLQTLHNRVQEFVRSAVLEQAPSDAASTAGYLRAWLSKGYLGLIDAVLLQPKTQTPGGASDGYFQSIEAHE